MMYVVRRSFRNYGKMMLPGSIVEPGNIKWFKTRLKDRQIIEVTPQTLPTWNAYFVDKFGVSLIQEAPDDAPAEVAPEAQTESTAKTVTVKPVVKVSIK
jgi:hypothetical protein